MIGILEELKDHNVDLKNNPAFIEWAMTIPNTVTMPDEPSLPPEEPPSSLLDVFSGNPFETVEEIKNALLILFAYRSENGLEVITTPVVEPLPDVSTCSAET